MEQIEPPSQFLLQGDVYEVEKLVGMKIVNGKKLYRVRWQGYSAQNDTLEPEENLLSCKDMIVDLEEKLERKRLEKQLKNTTPKTEKLTFPEEGEASNSLEFNLKEPMTSAQKDTFWRDFDEGKINVSDQDMYSKVKERAARAVSSTDVKQPERQRSEAQPLMCPKVVLKRRINPKNANALPTYKSTLQLKNVSFRIKKRKRYDVLRDYRKRRNRSSRRYKLDKTKIINRSNHEGLKTTISFQNPSLKQRCSSALSRNEGQSTDCVMSSDYLKVLQELPANDDTVGSDFPSSVLSNSSSLKVFFNDGDAGFIDHSSFKETCHSSSLEKAKETFKTEHMKKLDSEKDSRTLYQALSALSFHSSPNFSPKSRLNLHNGNHSDQSKPERSKLNVVTLQQIEAWGSFKLRSTMLVEKALNAERSVRMDVMQKHGFDLFMACSVQGQLDIIGRLCSRGMPLNQPREDGTTILMIMSQMGLHDVVRLMLRYSAHKDRQNKYGETALMLACRHRRPKVVKLLLEYGANFALTNVDGINALRISNKYSNKTDIPNIMNEHISRMKLEFEVQARNLIDHVADIKYALFPIQCFSLNESTKFRINFSHHVELESPGKGGKGFLLFIANSTIRGNCIRSVFHGISSISGVVVNGARQEAFAKDNNFVFRISCLRTGNNEVIITTAQYPQSEVKLVVCAYRVHYRRVSHAHCAENILINSHH